jgi:hypothetical protein
MKITAIQRLGYSEKFFIVLASGLFVRFLIAPYTTFPANWENITAIDMIFISGFNPVAWITSFGPSFYIFYAPVYVPYLVLNQFGVCHPFLLVTLFKIPSIIGDVVIFVALYKIGLLLSQNKEKSLCIATLFFLNPFTIYFGAVVGHLEELMIAFVLLSLLYLLKGKLGISAICLSIAVCFRFVPILLLPCFLVLVWRSNKSALFKVSKFLGVFLLSLFVLSIPYLLLTITLYSSSVSALSSYFFGHFLGIVGQLQTVAPVSPLSPAYQYNFTAILAAVGVWPQIRAFFSLTTFAVIYLIVSVLELKRRFHPAHSFTRYAIIVFALFMLMVPTSDSRDLLWIFPFLLLAAYLFSGMPKYVPHILWIANLAIFPLIRGHFLVWFDLTFPLNVDGRWSFPTLDRSYWLFYNPDLILVVSVLYSLFLVLSILWCLIPWRRSSPVLLKESVKEPSILDSTNRNLLRERKEESNNKHYFRQRNVLVVKLRRRERLIFVLCLILFLSYTPLIYSVSTGSIPGNRFYWNFMHLFSGVPISSGGTAEWANGTALLSDLTTENESWATWKFNLFTLPFMTEQMKKATSCYLLLKDSTPVSTLSPVSDSDIGWTDDSFSDGWGGWPGASLSTDGNIAKLKVNESSLIERYVSINASEYPYVLTRYKVITSFPIDAKFTINDQDFAELGCIPLSQDGNWHTGVAKLENGTVKTLRYCISASGLIQEQPVTVLMDFIKLIKEDPVSYIQITLNNQTILEDSLSFENEGLFTLSPLSPQYNLNFSFNEQSGYLRIPFDMNLAHTENILNITLKGNASWAVSSAIIYMLIQTAEVNPPAWELIPYYSYTIFIAFSLEIVVGLLFLKKLRKLTLNI